jgi:hypothetical protein
MTNSTDVSKVAALPSESIAFYDAEMISRMIVTNLSCKGTMHKEFFNFLFGHFRHDCYNM